MRSIVTAIILLSGILMHAASPELRASISEIIGNNRVGVAVITSRGDTISVGNEGYFDLASVMKFYQAAALSRVCDFDTLVRKQIRVTAEDLRRDTWSPMRAAADEVPFDISPVGLLDYSLNMSDNNAADILFDRLLAPAKVDSIVRNDYGAQKFAIGATEAMMHADTSTSRLNRATALDAAEFIYRFFTADTTASATLVKAVMAKDTPFGRQRIPSGIETSSAKVFHKTGTGFTAPDSTVTPVNDLAFISYPTARGFACYSLAVFTAGMTVADAEALIAEISRVVYTSVIVDESLVMNSEAQVYAGKRKPGKTTSNEDDGGILGAVISEVLFEIIDSALSD